MAAAGLDPETEVTGLKLIAMSLLGQAVRQSIKHTRSLYLFYLLRPHGHHTLEKTFAIPLI